MRIVGHGHFEPPATFRAARNIKPELTEAFSSYLWPGVLKPSQAYI